MQTEKDLDKDVDIDKFGDLKIDVPFMYIPVM